MIAALAVAVGVIALLSGGLIASRDNPGVYGAGGQLGAQLRDQGSAHLAPGARAPRYDSNPPTSGAHHVATIGHDETDLSDDQILTALAAGNIVFMYGTRQAPPGLRGLAAHIAAPFTPALARAGQAVILARRRGMPGVLALAWTRILHVRSVSDPQLRSFGLVFLGQGAKAP